MLSFSLSLSLSDLSLSPPGIGGEMQLKWAYWNKHMEYAQQWMGTFRILYSVVAQCFSKHLPQMRMAWTAASTIHRSVLLHIRCGKIRSGWRSKCVRGCVRQRKGCHIFAVIRFMINISAATLVSLLVDFLPLLGIVIIQLERLSHWLTSTNPRLWFCTVG